MRNVLIVYSFKSGMYVLELRDENNVVIQVRETANYHDIGSIVSNWVCNAY